MTVRSLAAKEQYPRYSSNLAERQSLINISYRHMTAKDLDAYAISLTFSLWVIHKGRNMHQPTLGQSVGGSCIAADDMRH